MGKEHSQITDEHKEFIENQKLFFVCTSPLDTNGHINLSPKGFDCFRVLSPECVGYLDIVGSGNETSAHLLENGRITFMFCAFDGPPKILRLYGKGKTVLPGDAEWNELSKHFTILPATRQIIIADIFKVKSSWALVFLFMNSPAKETMLLNGWKIKVKKVLKNIKKKKIW